MAGLRERHGDDLEENAEINVVPFIDIMLVLLIIFMVAVPLATVDVDVDLPASTAEPRDRPEAPVYLTLAEDRTLSLGEEAVERPSLEAALDDRTGGDKRTRVFLRADRAVAYGELMEVMNLMRAAGYLSIALVGLESASPGSGAENNAASEAGGGAPTGASPLMPAWETPDP